MNKDAAKGKVASINSEFEVNVNFTHEAMCLAKLYKKEKKSQHSRRGAEMEGETV